MIFEGKILLVDDEAHVRKFIGLVLRKALGNPVLVEAVNGKEAVEVYARERPDLVLLDVNMPLQDGIAALREIRVLDPDALVIMLTSLANRQTVEEALQLGAINYLRKDTPREEMAAALVATVEQVFES